jgi:hypothetical protein
MRISLDRAVAATDDRAQPERLMNSLNKLWPAEYEIKEVKPAEDP